MNTNVDGRQSRRAGRKSKAQAKACVTFAREQWIMLSWPTSSARAAKATPQAEAYPTLLGFDDEGGGDARGTGEAAASRDVAGTAGDLTEEGLRMNVDLHLLEFEM